MNPHLCAAFLGGAHHPVPPDTQARGCGSGRPGPSPSWRWPLAAAAVFVDAVAAAEATPMAVDRHDHTVC